jgi:competence protein ComEA
VQVAGAVRRPGVYQMPPESRVFQAIDKAGGLAPDADEQAITLAASLSDGCRVYVPLLGEAVADSAVAPMRPSGGVTGGDASSAAGGPLSINSAGVEELDSLPGIGPAIAQDIVTYREANGPFASVDELTEVPGIGPSKLEQLRPLVTL